MAEGLKSEIRRQLTAALRARDKVRLAALRMLTAAVTNREKELRHELSDDEVREVAGKEIKKRSESIAAFDAAGRTELADRERDERDVLRPFAPAQLDEHAIDALIDEAIANTGATSAKDTGKVMAFVMGRVAKGAVDGAAVQVMVKSRLG